MDGPIRIFLANASEKAQAEPCVSLAVATFLLLTTGGCLGSQSMQTYRHRDCKYVGKGIPIWRKAPVRMEQQANGGVLFDNSNWWLESPDEVFRPITPELLGDPLWADVLRAANLEAKEMKSRQVGGIPVEEHCWDDKHSTFPNGIRPSKSERLGYRMKPAFWHELEPRVVECTLDEPGGNSRKVVRNEVLKVIGMKFAGDFYKERIGP